MRVLKIMMIGLGCLGLGGCEQIEQLTYTVIENMEIERQLPLCELNQDNLTEFTCGEQIYTISSEVVTLKEVGAPIGKINFSVTLNGDKQMMIQKQLREIEWLPQEEIENRMHLTFGWIHEIKGDSENIVVNINPKYYIAKLN